jgi:hypothetical protein
MTLRLREVDVQIFFSCYVPHFLNGLPASFVHALLPSCYPRRSRFTLATTQEGGRIFLGCWVLLIWTLPTRVVFVASCLEEITRCKENQQDYKC